MHRQYVGYVYTMKYFYTLRITNATTGEVCTHEWYGNRYRTHAIAFINRRGWDTITDVIYLEVLYKRTPLEEIEHCLEEIQTYQGRNARELHRELARLHTRIVDCLQILKQYNY